MENIKTNIKILRTVAEAREYRLRCTLEHKSVGLVPTMGALHAGHCSLVQKSLNDNDVTMISIFVNPSQFAPTEDLNSYPRTLALDLAKLEGLSSGHKKVDAAFVPSVEEMYPNGITLDPKKQVGTFVSVLGLSERLEGASRPQFFRGVATVVCKLFNIMLPDRAYFGAKDIQQTIVVKRMVQDLLLPVNIVVMPTIREDTGLLLSSRNTYLSDDIRVKSSVIYEALHLAEILYTNAHVTEAQQLLALIHEKLEPYSEFEIDYIKINHPSTLLEFTNEIDPSAGAIISCAIKVPKSDGGLARLIDNVVLEIK